MKKIKLTWKIWLWIIIFILSLVSIFITPNFLQKGVLVTNVVKNSSAFEQGLRADQVITAIDGTEINNLDDYLKILELKTNLDEKTKTTITTKDSEYIIYSDNPLDISVSKIPTNNLRLGLDLAGGSRAFIEAENHKLTKLEVQDLKEIIENRLNAFGLSDMKVTTISDLFGNNRLSVEIAGMTSSNLKELISQQGKFEAKIGNETVFVGGEEDIASVSRSGTDSGIYSCDQISDGYSCTFRFTIYLSQKAAEKQANITKDLEVNSSSSSGNYLSKKLDLYLDDSLVDSLLISENLKGIVTTQIQISGSGSGTTQEDAYKSAQESMKKLQTILITGSLPFKLNIVKLDTISPTLGSGFVKYLFLAGAIALILVAITIFVKYKTKAAIAPLIVCTSEIIITLGITAFMKWDLDLMAIAGILAAIGTGVDDQIIVLDETTRKEELSIKQKIKNAFTIVFGAYFTSVASLLPLYWVGGGLLKGFVLTTLTGITLGVLITRPAFADMISLMRKENAS
jgi:preprotein translocase subunit SecD